ncbi:hypothetical protein L7F22_069356 [Adiantum nelumboides]|nr:hypothetical protein [Adiantum nelumboides]
MSQDALNSASANPPNPWMIGYLPHKSLITNNRGSSSHHQPENFDFFSEAVHALPKDLGNLLEQARGQRHGVGVFSQQSGGKLFQSQHLFDGGNPERNTHAAGEPAIKAAHGATLDHQQADSNGSSQGSPPENTTGKVTVILSAIQVRKAQADLEGRALIGMIAGPRPLVEELRGWIRNHWGSIGAEVKTIQDLPKNQYIIVFKTPEMAFKVLSSGHWLVRASPLCLFRWNKDYNPEKDALVRFPVWVEFPNLPLHYHNHLRVIGSALGKVLGGRAQGDYIPSWHPQALIEMNVYNSSITIALDDGESFKQPIVYKYLPNACFHCGAKDTSSGNAQLRTLSHPSRTKKITTEVPPLLKALHNPKYPLLSIKQIGAEFNYNPDEHNVLEVMEGQFEQCSTTNPIVLLSSGADRITLDQSGTRFFLCGIVGHCPGGMKIRIVVD